MRNKVRVVSFWYGCILGLGCIMLNLEFGTCYILHAMAMPCNIYNKTDSVSFKKTWKISHSLQRMAPCILFISSNWFPKRKSCQLVFFFSDFWGENIFFLKCIITTLPHLSVHVILLLPCWMSLHFLEFYGWYG